MSLLCYHWLSGAEGSMPVGKITKSSVEAMKPAAVDQYLLDRELKGFGVNCTPRPPVLPCPISAARPARPDRLVDPAGADRRIRCPGTGSQRRRVLRLPDPPLRSSPDAYVLAHLGLGAGRAQGPLTCPG
jgi:hypothetical protein